MVPHFPILSPSCDLIPGLVHVLFNHGGLAVYFISSDGAKVLKKNRNHDKNIPKWVI